MNEAPEAKWHEIGKHSVRIEAPDIVHMRVVGDLSLAHVHQLLEWAEGFPKPEKGFFSLIDIAEAGHPNLEILKSNELLQKMQSYRAMVYYRALFKHRTVIEIVQKISRSLNLSLKTTPLVAFTTEAEARVWIDEYRERNA